MTTEYDKDEVVQAYLQTRTIRGTSKKTGIETKALLHILEAVSYTHLTLPTTVSV